jgi:GNAT superfamily N-acetyltransferase
MAVADLVVQWHDAEPLFTGWGERRGVPVGHVYLCIEGARTILQDIHIRPQLRRRGFGSALLAEAVRFAQERGTTLMEGVIAEETPWLVAWYLAAGFEFEARTSTVRRSLTAI